MTRYAKLAGVFVSAMLVAGAANAAPKLSPELRQQAVAMRLVSCLAKAAHRHDDGTSDANDVAARIAPLCDAYFAREEAVYGANLSASERVQYRAMMDDNRTTLATEVVEHERVASNRLAQSD